MILGKRLHYFLILGIVENLFRICILFYCYLEEIKSMTRIESVEIHFLFVLDDRSIKQLTDIRKEKPLLTFCEGLL